MIAERGKFQGIGIYSVSDAARLTALSQRQVRAWINGYNYKSDGVTKRVPAVLSRQLPLLDEQTALGFLDVIELRVIAALLKKEFTLQAIRAVHKKARQLFESNHPFAVAKIRVAAKEIFSTLDDTLIDVKHRQFAIDKIVEPALEDLDFEKDLARRWWPLKEDRTVVIDPARRSGQPIVTNEGIATKILYDSYNAEKSVNVVADWYEVSSESVRGAIAFEQKFAA